MRKKIEKIIEQSFEVVRIGNKVYYTSKSKSDEKFKRRIEELLTLHGVSNRRELLIAFFLHFRNNGEKNIGMTIEQFVDDFLSN